MIKRLFARQDAAKTSTPFPAGASHKIDLKVRCGSVRKWPRFGGLLLFGLSNTLLAALPAPVTQALRQAQIPAEAVSVVVQPVDARRPLVEHNTTQAMNPASVMKLVTTYAALDMLGPAKTWKTGAYAERDAVDGRLSGPLILKGSGDPRFAIEHLWSLLRQLRVRGIRHIEGDILLDRSVFAVDNGDPSAFDSKPMRPYNVGPDGLLINFRAVRLTLRPGSSRPDVLLETPAAGLQIDNQLQRGSEPCNSDWKDRIQTRLVTVDGGQRLEFTGSYASDCGERALNLAPQDANAQASGLIRALWLELGGSLAGQVREGRLPETARLIAEHDSPPLAEAIRDINKFSNNVMARQLFLALGNDNGPATPERARERVSDWLRARNLSFPELVIDNGSGLSRRERLSAGSLNQLLLDAWQHPLMPEFIASLPIVGIDGTMKKRLNGNETRGRAHIKTGTLEGVKTAAGYALDSRGRTVAVTFLINHPRAQAGGPAIDALLTWIATRPGND